MLEKTSGVSEENGDAVSGQVVQGILIEEVPLAKRSSFSAIVKRWHGGKVLLLWGISLAGFLTSLFYPSILGEDEATWGVFIGLGIFTIWATWVWLSGKEEKEKVNKSAREV